jgi:hypothetical protein
MQADPSGVFGWRALWRKPQVYARHLRDMDATQTRHLRDIDATSMQHVAYQPVVFKQNTDRFAPKIRGVPIHLSNSARRDRR